MVMKVYTYRQQQRLLLFLSPAVNSSSSFMLSSLISTHQISTYHFYLFFYGTGRKIKKKTQNQYSEPIYQIKKSSHLFGVRDRFPWKFPLSFEKRTTRNFKNKILICFEKIKYFIPCCLFIQESPLKLAIRFHSIWLK